ncbi:nuclear transport factor 2 family protein [Phytoactinopolyspora mesophila]|uniref:Nuclear transport factor 2 family protein n=1 Tax=Phytoactinopolyspora mesophila TaxID=2650750 RepID=A0A7K3M846_9ACTN|nr:nuclear transport factor 2 family protein [Phytoactinopolyspora mesophila]NDL59132.1 nuclear transport factor 2 family protein [Phytoactinopolyspora mesophila]
MGDTPENDADAVVRTFWEYIDARAWDALGAILDADLVVEYTHTGETLDRSSFVRLNREYPGQWRADVLDLVCQGERAAAHVRVSDGRQEYRVASFATARGGRIVALTELWTEVGLEVPAERRPAQDGTEISAAPGASPGREG